MDILEARQKLVQSFEEGAESPVPAGRDPAEYIESAKEQLLANLITPIEAHIAGASFPEYALPVYESSKVWAIAKSGNHWLLTLEGQQQFALGFGASPEALEILGFSSSNALGEWLG